MLFIQNLSKSCGMEVYRVEKSNEWKLLYRLPSDLEDDSKFVEFFYGIIKTTSCKDLLQSQTENV